MCNKEEHSILVLVQALKTWVAVQPQGQPRFWSTLRDKSSQNTADGLEKLRILRRIELSSAATLKFYAILCETHGIEDD